MTIRAFRELPWDARQKMIQRVDDLLTRRIMEIAFLGDVRISWAQVACRIGGGKQSGKRSEENSENDQVF